MPLTEFKERQRGGVDNYVKIVVGVPSIIQIIDDSSIEVKKHWLKDGAGKNVGINCLGSNCPICARNASLGYNREHKLYVPARTRYRVNVLDLTPVKRCPSCGTPNSAHGVVSCVADNCGADLRNVDPEPLMEVRILERGRRLFEQFNSLESMPHPMADGKVIPIQSYPIMLVATGQGRNMVISAIPQAPNNLDLSQYEDKKLDLRADLKLSPEEIQHIMEGGNLGDILAQRAVPTGYSESDEDDEEPAF